MHYHQVKISLNGIVSPKTAIASCVEGELDKKKERNQRVKELESSLIIGHSYHSYIKRLKTGFMSFTNVAGV